MEILLTELGRKRFLDGQETAEKELGAKLGR